MLQSSIQLLDIASVIALILSTIALIFSIWFNRRIMQLQEEEMSPALSLDIDVKNYNQKNWLFQLKATNKGKRNETVNRLRLISLEVLDEIPRISRDNVYKWLNDENNCVEISNEEFPLTIARQSEDRFYLKKEKVSKNLLLILVLDWKYKRKSKWKFWNKTQIGRLLKETGFLLNEDNGQVKNDQIDLITFS